MDALFSMACATFLIMASFWILSSADDSRYQKTAKVSENAKPGYVVCNIMNIAKNRYHTSAAKTNNVRVYFTNKGLSRPFELTKDGDIKVGGQVDRESICTKKYERERVNKCGGDECCKALQVSVPDPDGDQVYHFFVKVIIEDRNDNAPVFPYHSSETGVGTITISEDINSGTYIDLPMAKDKDSAKNGVGNYSWTDFKPSILKEYFELKVSTSKPQHPYLEVKKSLDRETEPEYRFTLVATDKGTPQKTGTMPITIIVKDVNDNKPTFDKELYTATIQEGQMNGLNVRFKVTDPDLEKNSEIQYRILDQGSQASQFFQILQRADGATLHLKREIDYEKDGDMFKFKVVAIDGGQPRKSSTADVKIVVENVNDHKPLIEFLRNGKNLGSSYAHVSVLEGQGANQVIGQVHVSDLDSKLKDIKCRVTEGSEQFHLSEIKSALSDLASNKQYNLRSKLAFDREHKNSYTVIVTCDDNGKGMAETSTSQLTVQVKDLNDNEPQFTRPKYFGSIKENEKESYVQMNDKIEAKDKDEGENAVITYKLKDLPGRDDSHSFSMNTHSPTLLTREPLDYETKNTYEFLVVAKDHGKPSKSATSTVKINVKDTNDNPPKLEKANYNFKVKEEMKPHTFVGRIKANDLDTDPINKQVIYTIQNYNRNKPYRATDYLTIGHRNGVITTKKKIDRETVDSLVFTVSARNEVPLVHASKLISESIVHVSIIDTNDNSPVLKPEHARKKRIEMDLESNPKAENCVPFSIEFFDKDSMENGNGRVDISLGKDRKTRLFTLREDNRLICLNRKRGPDGLPITHGNSMPIEPGAYLITVVAKDNPINDTVRETKEKIMIHVRPRPPELRRDTPRMINRGISGNADSRNVTIIAVLASIAGLFCLILLIIIYIFKRCGPVPEKDDCSDKYDVSPPDNVNTLGRGHATLDYRTGITSRPEACGLLGSRMADMELDSCDENPNGQNTLRYETQWRTPKVARRTSNDDPNKKKLSKSCESLDVPGGRFCTALEDAQNGYQVLDPVLTIKSRNNHAGFGIGEQTLGKVSNSNGYQDLSEQTMNNAKKNNNYYDCVNNESEAMYSPRKSLKNAYFQTSFV